MSTTIDERIVEMRFDNRQFESNVSTTMSTLDKLKQRLNLTGASKGLENIDTAARKVDMSPLSQGAETVGLKFNAMYTIADQALRNITNSAMAAGKRIISALTIDPVKTGFSEYETQINAVQTILANTESKGTTIDDVNGALDELNTYADKTIYNFTEMTRNIGTFTAAGVDLDTSVSAIQGIANLAAVSGSTSQQASTAMYQLSQALSSGTVKLMDWNSVVNAGMGGEVFQNALKDTARVHGVAIDDIIAKNGSFRESLSDGWLTSEILTETLKKFTMAAEEGSEEYETFKKSLMSEGYTEAQAKEILKMANTATDAATKVKTFSQLFDTMKEAAQSGWSQTWEIVVGDFEEAKEFLTNLSNTFGEIIGNSANARNELLENWKTMGGRDDLLASLENVISAIGRLVKPIKEAFREIFPPTTAEQLVAITKGLKDFTEKLKMGDATSDKLKRTFKGLFAALDIVRMLFVSVFKAVMSLFDGVGNLGGGILEVTATFGDWIVSLRDAIKEGEFFDKVFGSIAKIIKTVLSLVKGFAVVPALELFGALLERVGIRMTGVGDFAHDMETKVKEAFASIGKALGESPFFHFIQILYNALKSIASAIGKIFNTVIVGIIDKVGNASFDGILDFINTLSLTAIGVFAAKFVKGLSDVVGTFKDFKEGSLEIMESFKGIMDEVGDTFKAFQQKLKAEALFTIAKAIGILALSLVVLSLIDSEKLTTALGAISMMFMELIAAMSILNKGSGFSIHSSAMQLVGFSFAIMILANACKTFSSLTWTEMGKGGAAIAGLAIIVSAASKIMSSKDVKTVGITALQLVAFAASLRILADACIALSDLNWSQLGKAGAAIVGLAAVMTIMLKVLQSESIFAKNVTVTNKLAATALQMIALAVAVRILADTCLKFADLEWSQIAKAGTALGGLAIGVLAVAGAIRLIPKKSMLRIASLTIAVKVMEMLIGTLSDMIIYSWEELGKMGVTLAGLAVGMVAIAGALKLMNGTIKGAASFAVAVAAISLLVPALKILGSTHWTELAKGLGAIAGAFVILGLAGLLLKPLTPILLTIAGALALVGVAVLSVGIGVTMFGIGLQSIAIGITALSAALSVGSTAIVAAITGIVVGIIKLIPLAMQAFAEGIIGICAVIADGAPTIGKAIKALILTFIDVIIECAPEIARGILELIVQLLNICSEFIPMIVDSLFDLVIGILNGLSDRIPELIQAAFNIFKSIFLGVIEALNGLDVNTLLNGLIGVGLIAGILAALGALAGMVPMAMVGVLGLAGIIAEIGIILAAFGGLAQIPGLTWIISEGGNLLEAIGTAIGQFVGGIAGGIAQGFTSSLPQIGTDLSTFMTNLKPFIDGASTLKPEMLEGVRALATTVLILTAADIINGLTSWISGGSSLTTFGAQLPLLGTNLKEFATNLGTFDESRVTTVGCAAEAIKLLAQAADTLPNNGGWLGKICGENDIGTFGSYLPGLGSNLSQFATNLGSFDESKVATVTCAANAIKGIAEAAESIPNEGGWITKICGDNSISTFGSYLPGLGKNLSEFATNLGTFDDAKVGTVTCAANAVKGLAEAANAIPGEGGWWQKIVGDSSIATFGGYLPDLGKNLGAFATNLGTFDEAKVSTVKCAADAIVTMADASNNIDGQAEWAKKIFGDNGLSSFGEEMAALGGSLKSFVSNLGTFSEAQVGTVNSAVKAVKAFATLADSDLKGAKKQLGDFGEKMVAFASDIKTFCSDLPSTDSVNSAVKKLRSILDTIEEMASANYGAVKELANALEKVGKNAVNKFVEALTSNAAKTKVEDAGKTLINKVILGAEKKEPEIKDEFKDAAGKGVQGVKDKYKAFYDAGSYLVDGFAKGISENDYKAAAKAEAMAKAAKQAAEEALGINSPSKVFFGIGEYTGEGFVLGLDSYGSASYKAGVKMADSARSGLSNAINKVKNYIDSGIDTQPTIRPVIDLSDVKSGVGAIGNMLDISSSVGVTANVGAIGRMMNQRNQNGGNGDVVSAIDGLRKELGNVGNTTYSINGITYDGESAVAEAIKTLVQAAKVERRV